MPRIGKFIFSSVWSIFIEILSGYSEILLFILHFLFPSVSSNFSGTLAYLEILTSDLFEFLEFDFPVELTSAFVF